MGAALVPRSPMSLVAAIGVFWTAFTALPRPTLDGQQSSARPERYGHPSFRRPPCGDPVQPYVACSDRQYSQRIRGRLDRDPGSGGTPGAVSPWTDPSGGARNANHCRSEGAPRRYTRAGPIRALQLDGPGPNQRRKLEVPPELADALTQWMIVRRTYLKVRTLPTLFCSKRGGAITPNSLLHLVKSNLQLAANRVNAGVLPPRAGPQVIRNTRLVLWLNDGVPAAEVAIRAGLKNIKGLGHLREVVNPGVRLTLSHGRDDDNLWDRLTPEA
ncbi:hypothetical protein JKP88DRAFT_322386 [Tribonema minus]|uniref:Uncharacterized protein n=1 Tax=Tribonema minus TaxID=303371 RepID=A0A835YU44_9STRA|nr:hypothetical protein JKP88DRAFT_322386 [Tribonema minus]